MKQFRAVLVVLILSAVLIGYSFDLGQFLTLDYLSSQKNHFQLVVNDSLLVAAVAFALIYTGVAALSIPGALIMSLAGGAFFGFWLGVLLVIIGASCGATLAFLSSRYLLRDWIEKRFPRQFATINVGVDKEGPLYLFALRLIPIFPFFMVNLILGLTRMQTFTFFWVSGLGMLGATMVFVNAGTELSKIESIGDITSFRLLLSFALLACFPFVAKAALHVLRRQKILSKYVKPKVFDRNLVVIGAGAAGLVSSYIAATVKAKVSLIEKHKMGGDCLNTGCVPSKALIKAAKVASITANAKTFGVNPGEVQVDFPGVMRYVHNAIKRVEPHDSIERYTHLGVDCIEGEATIVSPYQVRVNGVDLFTRSIIVATGARPFIPEGKGLDAISYLTSDTIWGLKALPAHLLIWGAGPIACEMAQAFSRLGSRVTVLGRSGRVMSKEDEDVSSFVMSVLSKDGVDFRMGHRVEIFGSDDRGTFVSCEAPEGEAKIYFDEVLVALGRKANTHGFGLEALGVHLNEDGTVKTDKYLASNIPTVYACGDVAGPYQFTHMAAHQAWYSSVNALFGWLKKTKVDYSLVPWVTYVDPEVARVGLNEGAAIAAKIPYESTRYDIEDLDRAITDSQAQGFVKVLTPPGKDTILGVTIVGQNAGELLAEFVLAMKKGLGLNVILGTIHAYPTMAEANKYVAGQWKRDHAPTKILALSEKLMAWRRGE